MYKIIKKEHLKLRHEQRKLINSVSNQKQNRSRLPNVGYHQQKRKKVSDKRSSY